MNSFSLFYACIIASFACTTSTYASNSSSNGIDCGDLVRIQGMKAPHFNTRYGEVVKAYDNATGRYGIRVFGTRAVHDSVKLIKHCNLEKVDEPANCVHSTESSNVDIAVYGEHHFAAKDAEFRSDVLEGVGANKQYLDSFVLLEKPQEELKDEHSLSHFPPRLRVLDGVDRIIGFEDYEVQNMFLMLDQVITTWNAMNERSPYLETAGQALAYMTPSFRQQMCDRLTVEGVPQTWIEKLNTSSVYARRSTVKGNCFGYLYYPSRLNEYAQACKSRHGGWSNMKEFEYMSIPNECMENLWRRVLMVIMDMSLQRLREAGHAVGDGLDGIGEAFGLLNRVREQRAAINIVSEIRKRQHLHRKFIVFCGADHIRKGALGRLVRAELDKHKIVYSWRVQLTDS